MLFSFCEQSFGFTQWCYSEANGSSFTISGSQITFVPSVVLYPSSDSIDFIIALGDVLSVGTPTDGSVSSSKVLQCSDKCKDYFDNNASKLTGALPTISGSLTGMGATLIGLYSPSSDVANFDITLSATSHDFYKVLGS